MPTPRINLIYARSRNGVIGRENTLPWHLPEDMAHFKECTEGAPVIMGRKTWDSLPAKFRPLPNRINIVVTRAEQWEAAGALKASSIEEAIMLVPTDAISWVMGGAQIYEATLPIAQRIYVTEINETYEGDTYAPELDEQEWQIQEATDMLESSTGLQYRFVIYKRIALPQKPTTTQEPTDEQEDPPPQVIPDRPSEEMI